MANRKKPKIEREQQVPFTDLIEAMAEVQLEVSRRRFGDETKSINLKESFSILTKTLGWHKPCKANLHKVVYCSELVGRRGPDKDFELWMCLSRGFWIFKTYHWMCLNRVFKTTKRSIAGYIAKLPLGWSFTVLADEEYGRADAQAVVGVEVVQPGNPVDWGVESER